TYRPWPWPGGRHQWPCQLSKMALRINIAGFTLSGYPIGFAPHKWVAREDSSLPISMGVTGVDRLELVVSPAIRSMLRLVRSVCLWFGLMGRTFDQTASATSDENGKFGFPLL